MARYLPTGHLVYGVADGLRAVVFDPASLEVRSDPVPVSERVMTKPTSLAANFAVSNEGSLVYLSGVPGAGGQSTLAWVDRQGREDPLGAPPRNYQYPRISPDGERIAVTDLGSSQDVWIWDLRRRTLSPLAREPALEFYSVWSPDSAEVIFSSNMSGSQGLYRRAADGTGVAEVLLDTPEDLLPSSLSADGRALVYRSGFATGFDLGVLDLESGEAQELLTSEFDELNGEISPDGRFLAYQSNESGSYEIYVSPFPDVGARRWPISTAGGTEPLWSPNGSELFYRAGDDFMAVPIQTEPAFEAGNAEKLFTGSYLTRTGRMYDISPDGERFLVIRIGSGSDGETEPPQLVLVLNWFQELERLVPTD